MTDIGVTGGGSGRHMVYAAGKTDHTMDGTDMIEHIVELVERKAELLAAEAAAAKAAAAAEPVPAPSPSPRPRPSPRRRSERRAPSLKPRSPAPWPTCSRSAARAT